MNYLFVGMALGIQLGVQFHAVSVEHAYVERTKVIVEVLIDEFLIDAEVVGVDRVLWLDVLLEGYKV